MVMRTLSEDIETCRVEDLIATNLTGIGIAAGMSLKKNCFGAGLGGEGGGGIGAAFAGGACGMIGLCASCF